MAYADKALIRNESMTCLAHAWMYISRDLDAAYARQDQREIKTYTRALDLLAIAWALASV